MHDALVDALGEQSPLLARGVRSTERGVAVEFPEMKGVQPAEGEQASPEAVDQAERVLPIVKALVALRIASIGWEGSGGPIGSKTVSTIAAWSPRICPARAIASRAPADPS